MDHLSPNGASYCDGTMDAPGMAATVAASTNLTRQKRSGLSISGTWLLRAVVVLIIAAAAGQELIDRVDNRLWNG